MACDEIYRQQKMWPVISQKFPKTFSENTVVVVVGGRNV